MNRLCATPSGNIIEVRTIAPWGLHLLTATGSNADATTGG